MTDQYQKRQQEKQFNILAREVAAKKSGLNVKHDALVQRVEGGAFVETVIWVSENDIEHAAMSRGDYK